MIVCILDQDVPMSRTAKLFATGGSQAVRLPADCRFPGKEVFIHREGERVVLAPRPASWTEYLAQGPRASADFMEGIDDLPVQERRFA
jgi:antitoxin VapB